MDKNANLQILTSNLPIHADEKLLSSVVSAFSNKNYIITPGFTDVHVHLREPGFSYKETIKTGTLASAKGGYTTVFSMPNLNPVPDSLPNLNEQLKIINADAQIKVLPYGAITVGEKGKVIADLEGMANYVCAFSDDGKGVQDSGIMLEAMQRIAKLNKVLAAHCEDESLLNGGYIHDGDYAKANNHLGICSASEYKQIERDLVLADKAKCPYHVCHISTKESVQIIRDAKKSGVDVTCETGPHYLVLSDKDLQEEGRFKMNPPLRSERDKKELINGVLDGTIDVIATDHAPHSLEEKSKGLKNSPFGITGIETAFSLMYTYFVKKNIISLDKLLSLLITNPNKRFGIKSNGFTVLNLTDEYKISSKDFLSKGKSTPFENYLVFGKCMLTATNDKIVYLDNSIKNLF
ncbi:MAG: dihydroorotase [Clostridia bacterium]|nr:dihydroorotase [Clostridia bacterium]